MVEDDEPVRKIAIACLERLGYRVLGAANGAEALALWEAHRAEIALLLTDMVMPGGITGLELAERLRGANPGLPVIVSSGYSLETDRLSRAQEEGVLFLAKPYEMRRLAEAVRQCLDPGRGGAAPCRRRVRGDLTGQHCPRLGRMARQMFQG